VLASTSTTRSAAVIWAQTRQKGARNKSILLSGTTPSTKEIAAFLSGSMTLGSALAKDQKIELEDEVIRTTKIDRDAYFACKSRA
jgi:hypothetical protein